MFQKKKCINCGASGRFLKLNDHNLCVKCASLKNKEMSMEDVGNEIADWFNSGKIPSKLLDIQAERFASDIRSDLNFERIFRTYNIARDFEKSGDVDAALSIYLDLLQDCPPGMDYYVRPCIILEKKKSYELAIDICETAISNINAGYFSGDIAEIEHRKERLERKLAKQKAGNN